MEVAFYRTDSGGEPVRNWLKGLTKAEKRIIGGDIKTAQYGWPLGMPVVRKLEQGLWEIVLLHGFIKKSQKIAKADLVLARQRKMKLEK
jgi:phage-related protein